LLSQFGTPASFGGEEDDDESFKHLSMDVGQSSLDDDGVNNRSRKRRRANILGCTCYFSYDSPCAILLGFACIGLLGVILGKLFPSSSDQVMTKTQHDTANWDIISNILGYTYFLSWTLSFYPQIITNYKYPAKARNGISLDFLVLNIIGFVCYAVYTTSFRYSDTVRKEYADRFGDNPSSSDKNVTTFLMSTLITENRITNEYDDIEFNQFNWPNPFNWTWGNSTSENSTHPTNSTNHSNAPVAVPQVKVNDVAFAWHALILASVTFVQIVYCSNSHSYCRSHNLEDDEEEDIMQPSLVEREESAFFENSRHNYHPDQRIDDEPILENFNTSLRYLKQDSGMHWTKRISSTTKILIVLLLFMCIAGAIMVGCNIQVSYWGGGDRWQCIDYLYFLSFIKLGVSVVKYIPQAILNYQRKSTSGFQIWNILLDFSGGSLSIIQLIGDSLSEARAKGLVDGQVY